ncbi:hypothetical protein SYNTR_1687 [Candidatus Syntrophocurvum alkaliphilum]|uniref:GGDEF domain-containing protein n=1 Tax=Candidatus Syntrophocurvum alkaliphilum TaxID=2293317 RepID=A0A6I6DC86_9FIRM|nr:GGDEF domain-containing protein [Candidatus Syntrophocurvum alkaliphilum]QGU00281.1 hypothetical protein SYNTR_1687 [Candidatus Syntrophocurvum alkaliphilum]
MFNEILLIDKNVYIMVALISSVILASILVKLVQVEILREDKPLIILIAIGLSLIALAVVIGVFANIAASDSIVYNILFYILLILGTTIMTIFIHKTLSNLIYQANYDLLTGIYNKNILFRILKNNILSAEKIDKPISIVFMDINNFKSVNDDFGHQAGDLILYRIAKEIKKHIRKSDVFIRYGGDEFILILPDTNKKNAEQISLRLGQEIDNLKINHKISLSLGVASFPEDAKLVEDLIDIADSRMYQHKLSVKNNIKKIL